jgi:hypothetical protein
MCITFKISASKAFNLFSFVIVCLNVHEGYVVLTKLDIYDFITDLFKRFQINFIS